MALEDYMPKTTKTGSQEGVQGFSNYLEELKAGRIETPAGPVSAVAAKVKVAAKEKMKRYEASNQEMMDWLATADWENISPEEWAQYQDRSLADVGRSMKGYIGSTKKAMRLGHLSIAEGRIGNKFVNRTANREDAAELKKIRMEARALGEALENAPYEAEAFGQLAPFLIESMEKGGKGYLIGASVGALGTWLIGKAVPGPGDELVAMPYMTHIMGNLGKATATWMALENMREIETGSFFLKSVDKGVHPEISRMFSHAYGGTSTLLEAATFKLLGKIIPGGSKVAGDILDEAVKRMAKTQSGRVLAGGTLATGGEATVESAQQLSENFLGIMEEVANDWAEGSNLRAEQKESFINQLTKHVGETFLKTLTGFAIAAVPGTSVKYSAALAQQQRTGRHNPDAILDQLVEEYEEAGTAEPTKKPETEEEKAAAKARAIAEEAEKFPKQPALEDLRGEEKELTPEELAAEQAAVEELGVVEEAEPEEVTTFEDINEAALKDIKKWQKEEGIAPPAEPEATTATEVTDTLLPTFKETEGQALTLEDINKKARELGVPEAPKKPVEFKDSDLTMPAVMNTETGEVFTGTEIAPWQVSQFDAAEEGMRKSYQAATIKANVEDVAKLARGFVHPETGEFINALDVVKKKKLYDVEKVKERKKIGKGLKAREEAQKKREADALAVKDETFETYKVGLTKEQEDRLDKMSTYIKYTAKKLARPGIDWQDIYQEGRIAALKFIRAGKKGGFQSKNVMLKWINEQLTKGTAPRSAQERGIAPRFGAVAETAIMGAEGVEAKIDLMRKEEVRLENLTEEERKELSEVKIAGALKPALLKPDGTIAVGKGSVTKAKKAAEAGRAPKGERGKPGWREAGIEGHVTPGGEFIEATNKRLVNKFKRDFLDVKRKLMVLEKIEAAKEAKRQKAAAKEAAKKMAAHKPVVSERVSPVTGKRLVAGGLLVKQEAVKGSLMPSSQLADTGTRDTWADTFLARELEDSQRRMEFQARVQRVREARAMGKWWVNIPVSAKPVAPVPKMILPDIKGPDLNKSIARATHEKNQLRDFIDSKEMQMNLAFKSMLDMEAKYPKDSKFYIQARTKLTNLQREVDVLRVVREQKYAKKVDNTTEKAVQVLHDVEGHIKDDVSTTRPRASHHYISDAIISRNRSGKSPWAGFVKFVRETYKTKTYYMDAYSAMGNQVRASFRGRVLAGQLVENHIRYWTKGWHEVDARDNFGIDATDAHEHLHVYVDATYPEGTKARAKLDKTLKGFRNTLEHFNVKAWHNDDQAIKSILALTKENPYEMVNYAFTIPKFARWLESLPSLLTERGAKVTKPERVRSMWQHLKDIVLGAVVDKNKWTKMDDLQHVMDYTLIHEPVGSALINTPESAFQFLEEATEVTHNEEKLVEAVETKKRGVLKSLSGIAKTGIGIEQKIVDWLDVEAPWKRINAHGSGLAFKNFFGVRARHQIQGVQDATQIIKGAKRDFGRNPTSDEWMNILFATEDPAYFDSLDANMRDKSAKTVVEMNQYFEAREQVYKDRGITFDFKERMKRSLQEKWEMAEAGSLEQDLIEQKMEQLERINFVHIPVKVLYQKTIEQLTNKRLSLSPKRRKTIRGVMNLFVEKKRRRLTLREVYEKAKDEQKEFIREALTPASVIMNYAMRYSKDMALLDIRDALRADGLAVEKGKKKPKGTKTLTSIKQNGVLAGNHVDHRALKMIEDLMSIDERQGRWQKFASTTKMAQFFNPIFLPAYDVYQSFMSGAQFGWKTTPTAPFTFVKAMREVWNQSEDYKEAMELGLFSKPFDFPWNDWTGVMQDVMTLKGDSSPMADSMRMIMARTMRESKDLRRGSIVGAAYHASWNTAWTMDEMIRMWTYKQLIKKGLSKSEAAQTAAKFHGDYASVPPKTRKFLNQIFFTPTFKIVMAKLYGSMMKSVLTLPIDLARGKATQAQKQLAIGAVTIVAMQYAFDAVMRNYGFEPESEEWWKGDVGRKYVRKIRTKWGPREFVITWSNPGNLLQRYMDRIMRASERMRESPATALFEIGKWDLHPVFRTAMSLGSNQRFGGGEIWNANDDPYMIGLKMMSYTAADLIRMGEPLEKMYIGMEPRGRAEARKHAERYNWMFRQLLFNPVISILSGHTRSIEDVRFVNKMRGMQRDFSKSQKAYVMRKGRINRTWLKNYRKRIRNEMKRRRSR